MGLSRLYWSDIPAEATTPEAEPTRDDQELVKTEPVTRDIMAQPQASPNLTPQFCFSTGALQDFLRASRKTIDDTIAENLNALVVPSRDGFDPNSTSQRLPRPSKRLINPSSCKNFKDGVLFPSWKARSDVLRYCESVAAAPDPEKITDVVEEADFMKPEAPAPYDRRDPYKTRALPQETRLDSLASLVRNEQTIERIVRARSWRLVAERCRNTIDGREEIDHEAALKDWEKRTGS